MKDLIEALIILAKYGGDEHSPTHCEHDELLVLGVPRSVSEEDEKRLDELGFFWSESDDCWKSYRFGSA